MKGNLHVNIITLLFYIKYDQSKKYYRNTLTKFGFSTKLGLDNRFTKADKVFENHKK
jgi:hypothetical protein